MTVALPLRDALRQLAHPAVGPPNRLSDGATNHDPADLLTTLSDDELNAAYNWVDDALRRIGPTGYAQDPPAYRVVPHDPGEA